MSGKLLADVNKVVSQLEEANGRVKNSNQNFLDQLEMLFAELENMVIQSLRRVKDRIVKKTIDKMSGNSAFQKELLASKQELDTKLKAFMSSGLDKPNLLEDFVSHFSKVRSIFLSDNKAILIKANQPLNKYKINFDVIDNFKKGAEGYIQKMLQNLVISD